MLLLELALQLLDSFFQVGDLALVVIDHEFVSLLQRSMLALKIGMRLHQLPGAAALLHVLDVPVQEL